jgi:hypothetical protein
MTVSPEEHFIRNYKGKVPQGSMRYIASKEALEQCVGKSKTQVLLAYFKV